MPPRPGLWIFLLFAVAAVAAATLVILPPLTAPLAVDLDRIETPPPPMDGMTLRIAIAPVLSPERTMDDYQNLIHYLGRAIRRPVRLVQRKTYGEVNELLRHGTIDLAIVCTGAYLQALQDQIPLDPVAVPVYEQGPVYFSLLVVRADSPFRTVEDLRDRTFGFTDPLSLSGHYYPISVLLDRNLDYRTFFSRSTFTYSHDGNLRAVMDGIVDAAAVDSLVYDYEAARNPAIAKRLRILHRSPPLGINPVVVPRGTDPALREQLTRTLLGMNDSPEGRKVLAPLAWIRFEAPAAGLYDRAREIHARVRGFLEK